MVELNIQQKPVFRYERDDDDKPEEAVGRHTTGRFLEVRTSENNGENFDYLVLQNEDGNEYIFSVKMGVNIVKDSWKRGVISVGDKLKFTLTELKDVGKPSKQKIIKVETIEG